MKNHNILRFAILMIAFVVQDPEMNPCSFVEAFGVPGQFSRYKLMLNHAQNDKVPKKTLLAEIQTPETAEKSLDITIDSEEFKNEVDKAIRQRMEFYNKGALQIVKSELKTKAVNIITNYTVQHGLTAQSPQVVKYIEFAKQLKKKQVQLYKEKYSKQNLLIIDAINQSYFKWVQEREGKTMPRKYMKGYIGAAQYTFDRASYKFYRADLEETVKMFQTEMLGFQKTLEGTK